MNVKCIESGKIYTSAYQAAKEESIDLSNLYKVLKGIRQSVGKKHFEYVMECEKK